MKIFWRCALRIPRKSRNSARRRQVPHRPCLEWLEERRLLATFVVVNTQDNGTGSLRDAITKANNTPGTDRISFAIIGLPGVQTIHLQSALPTITDPVTIDGTTQAGFAGLPLIELDGSGISSPTAVAALTITAGDSTVKGLIINRFSGDGIDLTTNGQDHITGNFIGTDATGSMALANNGTGISVSSSMNTIGGDATAGAGNVISGNRGSGIGLTAGTANLVLGNLVGTDVTGTLNVENVGDGITITSAGNTIGGLTAAARNILSGNTNNGIGLYKGATGNLAEGNFIGTSIDGAKPLQNFDGVQIQGGAASNTVGGTAVGARNVISGNLVVGLEVFDGATANLVAGNFVGVDATGNTAVPNNDGMNLFDGTDNTIGGTVAAAGNVISGNNSYGIGIGAGSGNQVLGNLIGTDITGTKAVGNDDGVVFIGSGITLGGTTPGAGNVISGNRKNGIELFSSIAMGNVLQANFIGTQADGRSPLGNAANGVFIGSSSQNFIGGTANGAANTIAFNGGAGVFIQSGDSNGIRANSIFSNQGLGIDLTPPGVNPIVAGRPSFNGPNNSQNFPFLATALDFNNATRITGTLTSTPSSTFTVEFFSNLMADPSGFGQGQTFLGSVPVTTDANGIASFDITFANVVPLGQFITSTATDSANNTSEFSNDVQVRLPRLIPAAVAVCAFQGVALTNVRVANLADEAGPRPVTGYSATINWGDGTISSAGTIVQTGNSFDILGSHTYAVEGLYSVSVVMRSADGRSTTASSQANVDGFVTSLYRKVLNRAPDSAGLAFWQQYLRSGISPFLVAQDFWNSVEHRAIEVNQFYANILHRPADAPGLAVWVNALLAGVPDTAVETAFLSSPEYTAAHPDATSFVTGLYADLFHRSPDAGGLSVWSQMVQRDPRARGTIAFLFLTSNEAHIRGIDDYYATFLGRTPSPAEEQNYLADLVGGATPDFIAAAFLTSSEFIAREIAQPCS